MYAKQYLPYKLIGLSYVLIKAGLSSSKKYFFRKSEKVKITEYQGKSQ